MKLPWNDYSGRLSPLKLTVLVALFLPASWTAIAFLTGNLGSRPLNEAIHQQGLWTIRLILVALAITPLKAILQWQRLILVRRMVGVAAFAYVMLHFTLYCADQAFNPLVIAREIALRIYLTIGFTALVGLAALAATSTDAMVRRMGRKWQTLHRLIYPICVLGLIHYSMQSKLEQWEPVIADGIFRLADGPTGCWRRDRNARTAAARLGRRARSRRDGADGAWRGDLFHHRVCRPRHFRDRALAQFLAANRGAAGGCRLRLRPDRAGRRHLRRRPLAPPPKAAPVSPRTGARQPLPC